MKWISPIAVRRAVIVALTAVLAGTAIAQPLTWLGGHVPSNAQVVVVYWGNPDPTLRASLDRFYAQIVSSSYLTWLNDYATPAQGIGNGTLGASIVITPSNTTKDVDTTDIGAEL